MFNSFKIESCYKEHTSLISYISLKDNKDGGFPRYTEVILTSEEYHGINDNLNMYFLRPLSLLIRLFANMLAGHVLLHIIAGAVIVALAANIILAIVPWIFIIVFLVLELGIAFLQAYVFSILLCIYLHDSIYSH